METSDDDTYIYSISEERLRSISKKELTSASGHNIKIVVEISNGDICQYSISKERLCTISENDTSARGECPPKKMIKKLPCSADQGEMKHPSEGYIQKKHCRGDKASLEKY